MFKICRFACRLGEVQTLLDLPRSFERSLLKQSRVYVVIGVTDVKNLISNNITYNILPRLGVNIFDSE